MKMYDNILEKVKTYEEKRGITYAKPGGKLFRYVKFFYVVTLIYTVFMDVALAIGMSMSDAHMHQFGNWLYTVLGLNAGLVIAFVLTCFTKKVLPSVCAIALNCGCSVALVFMHANPLEAVEGGYKGEFYWKYLIPLCLLIILCFALCMIIVKANLKVRKTYKKIVDNIYSMHHTSIEEGALDEEAWEEVLKNI